MIKLAGGLLLIIGMMFSSVKWNPINGKMAGHRGNAGWRSHKVWQMQGGSLKMGYSYFEYLFDPFCDLVQFSSFPKIS